jgi:hypothetical protein
MTKSKLVLAVAARQNRSAVRAPVIPGSIATMRDEPSTTRNLSSAGASWRSEIDALMFPVAAHSACCAVHRRAFRTLLRFEPAAEDCLRYFTAHEAAFRSAAAAKIAQNNLPAGANFHLTSRDIARNLIDWVLTREGESR